MYKLLRTLASFVLLALVLAGGTVGVGFACAGEVPDVYFDDLRPSRTDTYAPGFLDGLGRRDIAVWEDGTPVPGPVDGYIDLPMSGAAP